MKLSDKINEITKIEYEWNSYHSNFYNHFRYIRKVYELFDLRITQNSNEFFIYDLNGVERKGYVLIKNTTEMKIDYPRKLNKNLYNGPILNISGSTLITCLIFALHIILKRIEKDEHNTST